MDDSLPRRLIIPEPFNAGSAGYLLSPAEWLRIESIHIAGTLEHPLIVWATVVYTDQSGVDFATIATLPSLADFPVVAQPVRFTFAPGITASPSFVSRTTVLPPVSSVFDTEVFMQGLPDTVLEPGQGLSLSTSAVKPDGTPDTLVIESCAIWAEVVEPAGVGDVLPLLVPGEQPGVVLT